MARRPGVACHEGARRRLQSTLHSCALACPEGQPAAELDCLWDYLNAGGSRIVVADNNGDGATNAIWATFYDQGSNEIPQELGLFRTLAALACDVDEENMRGMVVSPWSKEVFLWGFYEYAGGVHEGGVCAIDIDDPTAGTRIVDPSVYQVAIGDVVPHPEVTDLLLVAPLLDADAWLQCMEAGAGACPDDPVPLLAERGASAWSVTPLGTSPPMTTAISAYWSSLSDPWILYGTEGGGAWRGELTW